MSVIDGALKEARSHFYKSISPVEEARALVSDYWKALCGYESRHPASKDLIWAVRHEGLDGLKSFFLEKDVSFNPMLRDGRGWTEFMNIVECAGVQGFYFFVEHGGHLEPSANKESGQQTEMEFVAEKLGDFYLGKYLECYHAQGLQEDKPIQEKAQSKPSALHGVSKEDVVPAFS